MPASVADARDLLVASVLCDDPVVFIDDRWLYEQEESLGPVDLTPLREIRPRRLREGADVTLVGASHSTLLCGQAADLLAKSGIQADVIDLRVIAPLDIGPVVQSVKKTGRLCAVDGSWENCGLAGEIIAAVAERLNPRDFRASPRRVTLPAAPAPTSRVLEELYYPTPATIAASIRDMVATS
jgi:pyruvate/2-oxoglutarate/acetoin dehydrogenase E1 component